MSNRFRLALPAAALVAVVAASVMALAQAPAPAQAPQAKTPPAGQTSLKMQPLPGEKHFASLTQITFGGENAEAYFAFDGTKLTFQNTGTYPCDQIFMINLDGSGKKQLSNGQGRTTCSHFLPGDKSIVYASTHLGGPSCPPVPGKEEGYVWPIYDTYDIFKVNVDGTGLTRMTNTPGYDAEATVAKDGRIVFTSVRDGDMELYSMNSDGTDVRRLTNMPGPDGGPFFSADGKQIVWRGRHPEPGAELDSFMALLKKGLWRPAGLDVFVMNRDGSNVRQVTKNLPGANWAPFFSPDGKKIIFASNMKDPRGGNFDLYLINVDGTGLEQVTFSTTFDGFPMFSPDGTKLVFGSNRNSIKETDTNLFVAEWKW